MGLGLAFAGLALVMATSRGVILAIGSALGALILLKLMNFNRRWQKNGVVFSAALFLFLALVVAVLYLGPAQSAGGVIGTSYYGNGSRAELFSRSLYLVTDAPLTGGGLGSFPGLYSRYLLSIPFFYLPNSHNLFLDVAIEQGIPGGLAFLLLYLASLWIVTGKITEANRTSVFNSIVLFSLVVAVVHGMVDNYLYNGVGSLLALLPVGLSMNAGQAERSSIRVGPAPVFAEVIVVFLVIGVIAFFNPLRSMWQANLGSVTLARSELDVFPLGVWTEISEAPELDAAEIQLRSALQLDPANRTANHRLGLIAMTRGDFETAARYLEAALEQAPGHRGIVKSLGLCYAWLGEWERAQVLLERIPEAPSELEVYEWWWDTQGRNDLSVHATQMVSRLNNKVFQP
jgi:tetratricopeptide (TPR) repeat protein